MLYLPTQVFELTHSSFAVGLLGAAQLVPLLIFALWGGAYADAMDRRKLLIVSEIFMTCGSLALAINGMFARGNLALIFVVSAAMSACNGFHRPALDAMTPRLVDREDLTAVSALNSFRFSLSAIGGPALGGIVMGALGDPANAAGGPCRASWNREYRSRIEICCAPAGADRHIRRRYGRYDICNADGAVPLHGRCLGWCKGCRLALFGDVGGKPLYEPVQRVDDQG